MRWTKKADNVCTSLSSKTTRTSSSWWAVPSTQASEQLFLNYGIGSCPTSSDKTILPAKNLNSTFKFISQFTLHSWVKIKLQTRCNVNWTSSSIISIRGAKSFPSLPSFCSTTRYLTFKIPWRILRSVAYAARLGRQIFETNSKSSLQWTYPRIRALRFSIGMLVSERKQDYTCLRIVRLAEASINRVQR